MPKRPCQGDVNCLILADNSAVIPTRQSTPVRYSSAMIVLGRSPDHQDAYQRVGMAVRSMRKEFFQDWMARAVVGEFLII